MWTNGIRGRVSYSYQQTDNRTSDEDLPDSPAHLVKFNLSAPLYKQKVFARPGASVHKQSGHDLYHHNGETLPGADADGFCVVNVTLFTQNLIKNLEFSAGVYNLFDCEYGDPASRFPPNRTSLSVMAGPSG